MTTAPMRCPTCDAPAVIGEERTSIAHLSWCRWSPRRRPRVVVLLAPTPHVEPIDEAEGDGS